MAENESPPAPMDMAMLTERLAVYERNYEELLAKATAMDFEWNHWKKLEAEGRLVALDYPVRPRHRDWKGSPGVSRLVDRLNAERNAYSALLSSFLEFAPWLTRIPASLPPGVESTADPHWINGWIPGLDAVSLYGFVAKRKPAIYMEVGSGNSTKFVRKAIQDHGLSTKIVSIDPHPRAEIDQICDEVIRQPMEEVDVSEFDRLGSGDILFIDNSHIAFPNSDVTVFFMEVIGRLPPGLLYGLHDIFLPYDYPDEWGPRFYNENYMLGAYLLGGGDGDQVILPGAFVSGDAALTAVLDPIWKNPRLRGILPYGGGFWLEKN